MQGVPPKYPTRLMQQLPTQSNLKVVIKGTTNLPIITSFTAASIVYSPSNLFCITESMETKKQMCHLHMKTTTTMPFCTKRKPKLNGALCLTPRWTSGNNTPRHTWCNNQQYLIKLLNLSEQIHPKVTQLLKQMWDTGKQTRCGMSTIWILQPSQQMLKQHCTLLQGTPTRWHLQKRYGRQHCQCGLVWDHQKLQGVSFLLTMLLKK